MSTVQGLWQWQPPLQVSEAEFIPHDWQVNHKPDYCSTRLHKYATMTDSENNIDNLPTFLVIRDVDKWSTQNHPHHLPEHRIELLEYERFLLQALLVICSIQHNNKLPHTVPLQSMSRSHPYICLVWNDIHHDCEDLIHPWQIRLHIKI